MKPKTTPQTPTTAPQTMPNKLVHLLSGRPRLNDERPISKRCLPLGQALTIGEDVVFSLEAERYDAGLVLRGRCQFTDGRSTTAAIVNNHFSPLFGTDVMVLARAMSLTAAGNIDRVWLEFYAVDADLPLAGAQ